MTNQSAVLILDDGELDNAYRMLVEFGAEVVRLSGPEIGTSVPAPRDLLITAGRRTLGEMPELVAPAGGVATPKWVCVHNQDFLPMRERLCEMGVHYLLQNALDEECLRRFLAGLLRSGVEQRDSVRLPLGGEVGFRTEFGSGRGELVDLSWGGCQILVSEVLKPGTQILVVLPPSLGGGEDLELSGVSLRKPTRTLRGGDERFATVVAFEGLCEETRDRLGSIVKGEQIGTKITPLAAAPQELPAVSAVSRPAENQRSEARHSYDRPIRLLGDAVPSADPALGRDLSMSGVRLLGCTGVEVGASVTVALYGDARDEPLVVAARVVRVDGAGEAALEFEALSSAAQAQLAKMLRTRPLLDALQAPDETAGRTVAAELRSDAAA